MSFIATRGNLDPRVTPILEGDMARPFKSFRFNGQQGGVANNTDLVNWVPVYSHGDIPDSGGVITLRNNRAYDLWFNIVVVGFSAGIDVGNLRLAFVRDSDNSVLSVDTEAWALCTYPPFAIAPQAQMRIIYPVTGGDEDIKVRSLIGNGFSTIHSVGTGMTVLDLGPI